MLTLAIVATLLMLTLVATLPELLSGADNAEGWCVHIEGVPVVRTATRKDARAFRNAMGAEFYTVVSTISDASETPVDVDAWFVPPATIAAFPKRAPEVVVNALPVRFYTFASCTHPYVIDGSYDSAPEVVGGVDLRSVLNTN